MRLLLLLLLLFTYSLYPQEYRSGDNLDLSIVKVQKAQPRLLFNTEIIPNQVILSQNYPNPFNPTTLIKYQIPVESFTTLKVYDVLGNEVATLINEEKPAGNYEVEFNSAGFASGVYLYKLQAGEFIEMKKMIILK